MTKCSKSLTVKKKLYMYLLSKPSIHFGFNMLVRQYIYLSLKVAL